MTLRNTETKEDAKFFSKRQIANIFDFMVSVATFTLLSGKVLEQKGNQVGMVRSIKSLFTK